MGRPVGRKARIGFVGGVFVKGHLQGCLECLERGKFPCLGGFDALLGQVVAQNDVGIVFEH